MTPSPLPNNRHEKPVVFLDRDGVINRDSPDYIKTWDEFSFLPGSLEAIVRLSRAGRTIIIITNQSGINRGIIKPEDLTHMHRMMQQAVAEAGGKISDIFFCPHHPDEQCGCRKPEPGMILRAQKKYGIFLKSAYMVGDSAKDIECARNAGCRSILVQTGNGQKALASLARKGVTPDCTTLSLYTAVEWILNKKKNLTSA